MGLFACQPSSDSGFDSAIYTYLLRPDYLICNVDAAVFSNPNYATFGMIIRNSKGSFLAAKYGVSRSQCNQHMAEAFAIEEALTCLLENGWIRAIIKTDCQLVCNLLNI